MPTIFRFDGFRFFFYSDEGTEPAHVHVSKGEGELKIWLHSIRIEYSYNLKASEERIILKIIKNNQKRFLQEWKKFYERNR